MVQREVGERLAAGPGDKAYGIPSVKVAYRADAEVVGRVPPTVFVPPPRVESALVRHHAAAAAAGRRRPRPRCSGSSRPGSASAARCCAGRSPAWWTPAGFAAGRRPPRGPGRGARPRRLGPPGRSRSVGERALSEGAWRVTDVLPAPAKLTVSLRVTGVRADGYHLIDAEMVSLDLADELTFDVGPRARGGRGPRTSATSTPTTTWSAGRCKAVGRDAHVRLRKRIPAGGGLGGGSSNAATVLRWAGCDDLEIAASLGRRRAVLPAGRPGPGHAASARSSTRCRSSPARSRWPCRRSAARRRRSTPRGTTSAARRPTVPTTSSPPRSSSSPGMAAFRDALGDATGPDAPAGGLGLDVVRPGRLPRRGPHRRPHHPPDRYRPLAASSGRTRGPGDVCDARRTAAGPVGWRRPARRNERPVDGALGRAIGWTWRRAGYLPAARRCQRVRFSIFLCFFLRIRLRRFLMREPMRGATLVAAPARPPTWAGAAGRHAAGTVRAIRRG